MNAKDDNVALSLRIPPPLHAEAKAYADSIGLSLNGLVAVALREYLDARPAPRVWTSASKAGTAQIEVAPARASDAGAVKLSPAERLRQKAQARRAGSEP